MRRFVYALAMMFLAWPAGPVAHAEWLEPPASAATADSLAGSGEPAAVMESGLDKERRATGPARSRSIARPSNAGPAASSSAGASGSARSISNCIAATPTPAFATSCSRCRRTRPRSSTTRCSSGSSPITSIACPSSPWSATASTTSKSRSAIRCSSRPTRPPPRPIASRDSGTSSDSTARPSPSPTARTRSGWR